MHSVITVLKLYLFFIPMQNLDIFYIAGAFQNASRFFSGAPLLFSFLVCSQLFKSRNFLCEKETKPFFYVFEKLINTIKVLGLDYVLRRMRNQLDMCKY